MRDWPDGGMYFPYDCFSPPRIAASLVVDRGLGKLGLPLVDVVDRQFHIQGRAVIDGCSVGWFHRLTPSCIPDR